MEMVPSASNLQDKCVGPVRKKKTKTDMSCSRNVEGEVKTSLSKADFLGYFVFVN